MQTVITYYKNLTRWDIKSYLYLFQSTYAVEELGKYIYERSEKENIGNETEKEFPILGVTNKIGVYLNEYIKGANINQPYKKVRSGELTYNPYRVNVGSIGVVQNEYDNFYISPAYVVFGTKEGLLNEYIYLVLSSDWFNPYLRAATSGSVRQNLTFDLLSQLKVPIPPLKIQGKIVGYWRKAQKEAQELNKKAEEKENEIDHYILRELGIEKKEYEKKKGPFVVWFKDFERWGIGFNDYFRQGLLDFKSKYEITPLSKIIFNFQYGTSEKANGIKGVPILRMNNIVSGDLNVSDLKYIELSKKEFESLKLAKGDLLFNRTNSKELVGKTAVFNLEGDFVFASYLIRIKIDEKKADPNYINILFNLSIIRNQIDAISRQIIGQANVNTEELGSFKIPLPPLSKQKEIAKKVEAIRAEIAEIKNKANIVLETAQKEIEKTILGEKSLDL
jgi:type I restriction enzyme S subunit